MEERATGSEIAVEIESNTSDGRDQEAQLGLDAYGLNLEFQSVFVLSSA